MKKFIYFFFLFLSISMSAFCQYTPADSSVHQLLTGAGLNSQLSWWLISGLIFLLGHFAIPQKWTSIFQIIETCLHWLNEKTNRLSKTQKTEKLERDKVLDEVIKNSTPLKTLMLFIAISLAISGQIQAQKTHSWRIYPFKTGEFVANNPKDLTISAETIDSTLYFGPSISLNVFQLETKTKDYKLGAVPGVGYGLKWNPYKWKNSYLFGIDAFAQADVNEQGDSKYFTIDFLPVITILNWVHIGYGPRFNIGLNGTKNASTGVFVLGIAKTL